LGEETPVVTVTNFSLEDNKLRELIKEGYRVDSIAMTYIDGVRKARFVVDSSMRFKQFKVDEVDKSIVDKMEDPLVRLMADATIELAAITDMHSALFDALQYQCNTAAESESDDGE
jgi:DNA recombination-dependent growth factor C